MDQEISVQGLFLPIFTRNRWILVDMNDRERRRSRLSSANQLDAITNWGDDWKRNS
ncbi:hypothetical protein LSTR_LSTR017603 [Laodelphax striatellus]|uniref:Uncharacterized protein n=1 Tax=Laodelphax striatellus TaxID=195883 RepID=A0A482WVR4_LAOST|nr:hypothetical protein LSTR_LSTR017603 [Laodelphax striatellus]